MSPSVTRSILVVTALAVSTQAGCKQRLEEGDDVGDGWSIELGVFDAGLIGVYAPADDDVWAVGADPGDGLGGLIYRFDGQTWERQETGIDGHLWWIHGDGTGRVWMVGTDGLVIRYEPETGYEKIETPDSVNLFGVFAFADDNVYVCGGDNLSVNRKQVLWHYDGTEFKEPQGFVNDRETDEVLTKMFARTPDELWVVGGPVDGLHMVNDKWSVLDVNTGGHLTTVHGNEDLVVAAGGMPEGTIVENDGTGFVEVDIGQTQPLNGVALAPDGRGAASGWYGTLMTRDGDGTWAVVDHEVRNQRFHAVALTPSGDIYAAGGIFGVVDITDGLLLKGKLPEAATP